MRVNRTVAMRGVLVAGVVLTLALVRDQRPADGFSARIAFYRVRAAGRSTYAAWAGLGAAYYQRARATGSATDYAEAEGALRQSLAYQRNAEALKWQAATLADQHRFAEALPLAREAVDAAPFDVNARGILFDTLMGLRKASDARPVLDSMLAAGKSFETLARLSAWHQYQGYLVGALEAMEQACRTADTSNVSRESRAWCRTHLALLYKRSGFAVPAYGEQHQARAILPGLCVVKTKSATKWDDINRELRRLAPCDEADCSRKRHSVCREHVRSR